MKCEPPSLRRLSSSPVSARVQHPGSSSRALPKLPLGLGSTQPGASPCLLSQASPGLLCPGQGQIKAWPRALAEKMTQEQLSWVLI